VRILVVEDEDRIASFLKKGLTANGYVVVRAATGGEALEATQDGGLDLAILDLGLPDEDGLSILQRWRGDGLEMPVIILTARDGIDDRVQGLNLGADDYLPKPFAFDELLARVRARLRPRNGGPTTELKVGGIRLDLLTRRATVDDRSVELTSREFALLEEFMRHPHQVFTRAHLLSRVWNLDFDPQSNLVDVYVGYLRRKIGETYFETVRGAGYRLSG
jgi:two-component system copper resistance phosphate regulon response regulator CusR